ncbi:hypothetical protein FSPOR_5081 [Fusarium sporotrichioides]|uniref:Uncharacterized protein n=1 Tax=Fusarium sporotrichioides TaxID=5514 RepID=A0A395S9J0_FUSSP|nr:hypothetical protein FSPOR_5081 [Fusarium sporotrichioides]
MEDIVRKINAGLGPREIDLSVEACGIIPVDRLAPGRTLALSESIVSEIFRETGIPADQASLCWEDMVTKMSFGNMLQMSIAQRHRSWSSIAARLRVCERTRKMTNSHVSMTAPDLAFIIAVFFFRKMQTRTDKNFRYKKYFINFFGDLNCMQWLPVAIKVHSQINGRVFLVRLNERVNEPLVHSENIEGMENTSLCDAFRLPFLGSSSSPTFSKPDIHLGETFMVVTTKKPPTNIYEAGMQEIVRQIIGQGDDAITSHSSDSLEKSRKSIEKVESDSTPLESVAPSIKQSPDPEDQHDESLETQPDRQINSDTLCDHARHMKVLGKRLASPDKKFVRRVRRDIRRFADLTDERENETELEHPSGPSRPPSSREFGPDAGNRIDLFGRYKMLWKGSL